MSVRQAEAPIWTQTMQAIARWFASLPFVGGKRAPRELWRDGYGGAYGEPRPGWVGGYGHHYLQSEAVFAAVNAFSNRIAATEMHLFKQGRDGEQEQMQHEVLDLLNNPNDFLTRTELMWHTASDLKLAGNAYWFLSGPANGRPTGIWRCNPRYMTVARSKEDYISGYVYEIDGEQVPLYPEEVIHFKRPNPFDEFYGLGDIAVAALAARTGHSMAQWNRSIFEGRYGVPAGVVSFTDWLNDTQFAQAQKDWLSTYGSGEKRTAFLRGGRMQFQSIGLTQTELDFLNSARWEQEKVYRVFGTYHLLPAETSDDRKLNERMFLEEHAWPLLLYIMEVLTDRLLAFWGPRRGAGKLILKVDDIRPRERALDLDERRLKLSSLTFNEARALDGDDPLDGGDEILYVHIQSGTLLPMEQALMPPPPPQLQPGSDPDSATDEDEESNSDDPQDAQENAEEQESAGDEVGDDIGESTDKAATFWRYGFDGGLAGDPALSELQDAVQRGLLAGVQWLTPQDWHLSLAYAANPLSLPLIRDLFWNAPLSGLDALPLAFEGLEAWETQDGGSALVARVALSPELEQLQRRIVAFFDEQGIAVGAFSEPDAWKPHITLAYGGPGLEAPDVELPDAPVLKTLRLVIMQEGDGQPVGTELRRWQLLATSQNRSADKAAILRELGQWERFALARLGKAARPFVAESLPGYLQDLVREALQDATDKQGVTRCFALARSLVQGGLDALEMEPEPAVTEETNAAHEFEMVAIACPLCGSSQTRQYADHGGLCVCPECGQTFDPLVEVERA